MRDCADNQVCKSGIIRDITYYSIKPSGACSPWWWNGETKGATGYGNLVGI